MPKVSILFLQIHFNAHCNYDFLTSRNFQEKSCVTALLNPALQKNKQVPEQYEL